ncbi:MULTISPECIES: CBS domain-containing protein [Pedobacter]|uniref:CBS domain containing protein n=1 Tax=Pedobacter heparinus (strain ATCC 13125 / DSM 2366 / CIP 104194 / JCM 7457 / NBRC 12017 / NCIMB 9290 / NRRL B-14731 / HIM 762-3) TaxID=485917 RepID=C6XU84_PEDHD|nr:MULTISPECIES: CBS domain-containing protein [Pedobacter]ACU05877.1 CBS domain containing protein [Pedobacter heparinus DSM 2366]MBB5438657.1 CBS domain-containing protein [Pedobacter sp. AK017]
MKTVQQLLSTKSAQIFSVTENSSVLDALKVMMEKNISALMVLDGKRLVGIFTERDYARKIILHGKSSAETAIKEVMTAQPITVLPSDGIDFCMGIMTDKHIRHLPVMQEQQLLGMVSIGDVVKFIIEDQKQTISQLESYISS